MLLDVPCKTGRLQATEDGVLCVVALFTKAVIWRVQASSVVRIAAKDGSIGTSNITIFTEQGQYQADTVSRPNASKLYALFPHLEVGSSQPMQQGQQMQPTSSYRTDRGRHWYQDQKLRSYIATYEKEKDMQKDVAESGQYGWLPQNTVGTGGQLNRSLWIGLKNSKQKFTITYVRTPEWLAQN